MHATFENDYTENGESCRESLYHLDSDASILARLGQWAGQAVEEFLRQHGAYAGKCHLEDEYPDSLYSVISIHGSCWAE